MSNIKNNEFVVINKLILVNSSLFTHEELLILLFLHTGQKSISLIRSKLDISQTKLQKSISFLENNGFIEQANEVFSLGESADFSNLLKRSGAAIGTLNVGEKEETGSLLLSVTNYQDFVASVQMPAKCREISYMIFDRLGWDTSRPFDHILNIGNWIKECRQLTVLSGGEMSLIRDAIDLLKEKNYSITSPRSLLKTVASIKNGNNLNFKKQNTSDEDYIPEIF